MQAIGAQRQCQVGIVVNANGERGVGSFRTVSKAPSRGFGAFWRSALGSPLKIRY